ncbi:MAG: M15 family metallopeptidase [Epsilonproteobacteria bacterium]|nr:M15 family metallopeptidase [Campylobacterota bacterium]
MKKPLFTSDLFICSRICYYPFFIFFFTISLYANSPQCYKEGYGDLIKSADEASIVLNNEAILPYRTDSKKNTWDEKIDNSDLAMQLSQRYKIGQIDTNPPYLFDPGRLRYQPFFEALYGKTKKEIEKNLVQIDWPTSKGVVSISVNKIGGVDKKLYLIGQEIAKLPPTERIWGDNPSTYYFRTIKDTNRLSMHSFGIAIDISPSKTQYWKNEAKDEMSKITYKNSVPLSIVQIFEKYGFIWGGRWYHYDTMHFEYRPELLAPSCL